MSATVYLGSTARSNSLRHAVIRKEGVAPGLSYHAVCGVIVRSDGVPGRNGGAVSCRACRKVLRAIGVQP